MSADIHEPGAPPPSRRPGRSGDGGAPVSGALTIVLAVVAVVAGFLILRAITGGDDGGTTLPSGPGATTTVPDTDATVAPTTTAPETTTTTQPPLVTEGATVVVANANGVNGSAGAMTDELGGAGFTMGSPTNATTGQLESTVIYYDPTADASLAVAESVNRVLGGDAAISQVGTPAPVSGGELEGEVLVLLGNDKAGSTLAQLAPAADDGATTVTAPEVSGGEDDPDDPDAVDPDDDPDA